MRLLNMTSLVTCYYTYLLFVLCFADEAKKQLSPIMSGDIPQDDYRKMLALKAMKTAPQKRAENKVSCLNILVLIPFE